MDFRVTNISASTVFVDGSKLNQGKSAFYSHVSSTINDLVAAGTVTVDEVAFDSNDTEYETVAASQTDQALGTTGKIGDLLKGLLIIPATTAAGNISIKDGTAGSSISVFATGTLADLSPIYLPMNMTSKAAGGWLVTTGANVSVIATGRFT